MNGGYVVGVILRAAEEALDNKSGNSLEAASWSVDFLDAAQVGLAEVKIDILRRSTTSIFLRADLRQKSQIRTTCSVLLLDLAATMSHTLELPASVEPELPFKALENHSEITATALQQEGWQTRDLADFQSFYRTKPNVRYYLPPGSDMWDSRHVVHPTLGPSFRDMWFTLGDKALNPGNLPVAIDSFLPLHLNFPQGHKYFITTQSIQCETKRISEPGWTWIFGRAKLMECSGGKYVMDVTLYDQQGRIVALARLVQVLISLDSLMGKKGKAKQEKETKGLTDNCQQRKSRL